MQLSIIILNYNVRYFLELCIKSVQKAIEKIDAEIIVIDNNSPDDSCEMVEQLFPDIKLIKNDINSGFAKANNIAVNNAKGEFVCILNPDTVVAEDTFIKLLEFAKEKNNLGIVGCKLIDGKGTFLPESKRNIPSPKVAFKKLIGLNKDYYANHINESETHKVEILVGAFMLLTKEVYQKLNGFDEDYFMYGEDIDLSYRALKLGLDNYYFGETTCIHFKGESTIKDKTYAKRFFGAMKLFYKKNHQTNFIIDGFISLVFNVLSIIPKSEKTEKEELFYSVLNANELSYKAIIHQIETNEENFKIQPNSSDFIIGSFSSTTRGKVEKLKS